MSGYTKLFSTITDSTIWQAPDSTRLVWITMLAMADQHGYVGASVPGLASRARVSLEACLAALDAFQKPDEWSRTKEFEGRRIAEADGGWILLNHAKYRAAREADERRDYMKNYMRDKRAAESLTPVSNVSPGKPPLAQAEAEAKADTESKAEKKQELVRRAARFDDFYSAYPVKKGKQAAAKAWAKLNPTDEQADAIIFKLRQQAERDDDWLRGFAPHPATYLNGQRWNDEIKRHRPATREASKTMQAMQTLEGIKNGMAKKRDNDRVSETPLLGVGETTGERHDRGHGFDVDGDSDR